MCIRDSVKSTLYDLVNFIGNPVIALLLTLLIGTYTLGVARGKSMDDIMKIYATAASGITMVLLIISGAGALKQILIDSGVSQYIGGLLQITSLFPFTYRVDYSDADSLLSWICNSCRANYSGYCIAFSSNNRCKSRANGSSYRLW